MLGEDLAALYQVLTKVLVQVVKRNAKRFPPAQTGKQKMVLVEMINVLRAEFRTQCGNKVAFIVILLLSQFSPK